MVSRARSSLAVALQVHGDHVELVEALYLEQLGEVTHEVEQAERARDLAACDALEHLAGYRAHISDQQRAIAAEYERLAKLAAEYEKRASWVDKRMAGLVRARDPAAKSRRAGLHTVKVRDHYSVIASPDLDLERLPEHWLRTVPAVPAKPATVALAKTAAKKDLRAGYRVGEPPGAGWYECSSPLGRSTCYLFRGAVTGQWRLAHKHNGERPVGAVSLKSANLTVTGEHNRYTVRWRHHVPGVELKHRLGVTVV